MMDALEYFEVQFGAQQRHPSRRRMTVSMQSIEAELIKLERLNSFKKIIKRIEKAGPGRDINSLEIDGQVITFRVEFDGTGKVYSFAALYVEEVGAWFTTGSTCPPKGFPTLTALVYYYHVMSGTILNMWYMLPRYTLMYTNDEE